MTPPSREPAGTTVQTYENRLTIEDAGFCFATVQAISSQGTPFTKRVAIGMPRIPETFLKNVFYLYPSEKAARDGEAVGGTGFLVSCHMQNAPEVVMIYAVTNYHVAVSDGFSVIRVNQKDGPPDIFEFGPEDWHFDPEAGHDVAAVQLPLGSAHDYKSLDVGMLMSRERHAEKQIAAGDDAFFVGRFVDLDGKTTNKPAARFGHISIERAPATIAAFGKQVEVFCLDTNSRGGYSGSPVYVYRTPYSDLKEMLNPESHGKFIQTGNPMLMLLGIHTGQFPELWKLEGVDVHRVEEAELVEANKLVVTSRAQIKGLSGMTICTPAWAILDLLNKGKLKEKRDLADAHLATMPKPITPEALAAEKGRLAALREQQKASADALKRMVEQLQKQGSKGEG